MNQKSPKASSVEKPEQEPEEKFAYKVGVVPQTDVKITRIEPKLERSVYFVMARRNREGGFKVEPATGKLVRERGLGTIMRDGAGKMLWEENERSMTPKDFVSFIEHRKTTVDLT